MDLVPTTYEPLVTYKNYCLQIKSQFQIIIINMFIAVVSKFKVK